MPLPKPLILLLIALVTGVVATSLYISGSPTRARNQRRDTQRADDLQQISYGVDYFLSVSQRLPNNLDEISARANQPLSSYYFPQLKDPRTGSPYEYRPLDLTESTTSSTQRRSYELCAIFEQSTQENSIGQWPGTGNMFWQHPAGRTCFTLEAK